MWRINRLSVLLLIGGVTALLAADELSNDERQMYVDILNTYRLGADPQAANMKKMELDIELETLAKGWASRCVFEHGNPPNEFAGSIGQNIYKSTNRADIVVEAMKAFYSEVENFRMDSNTCEPGKVCSHYTQLMWADSYKVGCGVSSKCTDRGPDNDYYIFVCNYASAGNVVGQKPYAIGTSCSSCEVGWSGCDNNLCKGIEQDSLSPVAEDKSLSSLGPESKRKIEQLLESYKSLLPNRFSQIVDALLNYLRSKT